MLYIWVPIVKTVCEVYFSFVLLFTKNFSRWQEVGCSLLLFGRNFFKAKSWCFWECEVDFISKLPLLMITTSFSNSLKVTTISNNVPKTFLVVGFQEIFSQIRILSLHHPLLKFLSKRIYNCYQSMSKKSQLTCYC